MPSQCSPSHTLPPHLQHPLKPEFGIYNFPWIQVWREKAGALLEGAQDNSDSQWMNNDLSTPVWPIHAWGGRVYELVRRPVFDGEVVGRSPVIPRDSGKLGVEFDIMGTIRTAVSEILKLPRVGIKSLAESVKKFVNSDADKSTYYDTFSS